MEKINKNSALSLQYQIRKSLEKHIVNSCNPGEQMPSERELAAGYSVARGTVSRTIDRLVHDGLLVKVHGKGIFVAQVSKTDKNLTPHLGLILPFSDTEGGGGILQGAAEEAHESGYDVVFASSGGLIEREISHLNRLRKSVRGIILYPHVFHSYRLTKKYISDISKEGFPIVLVDKRFEGVNIPCVETDNSEAQYRLTLYLAEKGHRNIGHVTSMGWENISSLSDRMEGYLRAVKEKNLRPHIAKVNKKIGAMPARTYIRFLQENGISAISASNNYYPYLMQEKIVSMKLEAPVLEIAGMEKIFSKNFAPSMIAIQRTKAMGRKACRMLLNSLLKKGSLQSFLLPPDFFYCDSESCNGLPGYNRMPAREKQLAGI